MKGSDMSGERCNGWLRERIRFLLLIAGAVAAVVIFAWRSQAAQDERIAANRQAVAVIEAKLGSIGEKLDDLKELIEKQRDPKKQ
jgi:hypothetical protein